MAILDSMKVLKVYTHRTGGHGTAIFSYFLL
jgi:hypothetical protein